MRYSLPQACLLSTFIEAFFLNWGSLHSDVYTLCQVDVKLSKTGTFFHDLGIPSFVQVPALNSCPELPPWWTTSCKMKESPFPPKLPLVMVFPHNRNPNEDIAFPPLFYSKQLLIFIYILLIFIKLKNLISSNCVYCWLWHPLKYTCTHLKKRLSQAC